MVGQKTTGWRLKCTYEYYQTDNWIWGFSAGYAQTKGIADEGQINETEFKAGHWPIYVSPKYMFFDMDSFRPFFKGMLGIHFSDYDRKGPLGTLDSGDSGFYGGLGAGVSKKVGESVILNVEYEWAYLSNSWYKDGFFNSLMFSVGYSFY